MVDFREDPALVAQTVTERGYTGRVLIDRSGDTAGRVYGVFGTPTAYLIDREGRLIGRIVGPRDWDAPAARTLVEQLVDSRGGH